MVKEQEFDDGKIKIKKDEFQGVYDLFAFYIILGFIRTMRRTFEI